MSEHYLLSNGQLHTYPPLLLLLLLIEAEWPVAGTLLHTVISHVNFPLWGERTFFLYYNWDNKDKKTPEGFLPKQKCSRHVWHVS